MAKCTVMSYLDQGAPQFLGKERDAIHKLMSMAFTQGYNTQYPQTLVVDTTTKTIHLSFPSEHGFREAHLLSIVGTDSTAFQSTRYRVIQVPTTTTLVCLIDNYNEVQYPESDSSTTIAVKVAPLDWEVVYKTDLQLSVRSKNPASSGNILTLKSPSLPDFAYTATGNYTQASAVFVSENIDDSNGSLLNDYTANHSYNNHESFYWLWNNYSHFAYSITYGREYRCPWYIVGDDKFFYLILSPYTSSNTDTSGDRNYARSVDNSCLRQCYMFGDPEPLAVGLDIDKTGTVLTAHYSKGGVENNSSTNSACRIPSSELRRNNNSLLGCAYFAGPLDMETNDLIPLSLSTIDFPFSSTAGYNMGGSNFHMKYPHETTRGLLFFPIYTRVYRDEYNSLNYYRSILPYARFCPISSRNLVVSGWVAWDYKPFKNSEGNFILPIVGEASGGSSGYVYTFYLFELD